MTRGRFLRSDEKLAVGHGNMKTALGFDIMYVDYSKNAEKYRKIAIFYQQSTYHIRLMKGGGSDGQIEDSFVVFHEVCCFVVVFLIFYGIINPGKEFLL